MLQSIMIGQLGVGSRDHDPEVLGVPRSELELQLWADFISFLSHFRLLLMRLQVNGN